MLLRFAHGPETIKVGDLEVRRLGYGAMRLPGPGAWGEPNDPATAHAVLRRAIELGVNFIDTAWYYGPLVANRLIAEALHPYPSDLVIATSLGLERGEDKSWLPAMRPEQLREAILTDLRTLKLEQLKLVHLRWVEKAQVSFDEALDVLIDAQKAGQIRNIALSNVTVEQLDRALDKTPIAAVQNLFSATSDGDVLARCEELGIAFVPYFSLDAGMPGHEAVAKRLDISPMQLSIAWLLASSPMMLPIPGTSKVTHLEENCGAVHVALDGATMHELSASSSQTQLPRVASAAH